jgi:hypothetical protein
MPLHPIAQNLVDARLPTWSHGSEMPKYLRREPDVDVHLRIGLSGATAHTRERALRRTHYLPPTETSARSNCSFVHSGASSGSTQKRLVACFFPRIAFPHRNDAAITPRGVQTTLTNRSIEEAVGLEPRLTIILAVRVTPANSFPASAKSNFRSARVLSRLAESYEMPNMPTENSAVNIH